MSCRNPGRGLALLAGILSLLLGGCTWPWTTVDPEPTPPTQTPPDEEPEKPEEDETAPDNDGDDNDSTPPDPGEDDEGGTTPPPPPPAVGGTPTASPVPGRPGFVFSPFNNKIIDVKGIPSGTVVADPQFPKEAKKHFKVP